MSADERQFLGGASYDRAAERRVDEAWLAERMADPQTQVLVLSGTRFRLEDGHPAWVPGPEAPAGDVVLLGQDGARWRFAVIVGHEHAGEDWVPLRPALTSLDLEEAGWLVHAVGIAEWRHATRHCPRCGGHLSPRPGGHVLRCDSCGRDQFPRVDPAVIAVVVDGDRCLLGHNPAWPEGRYSTLAGFVEPGEALEDAVRREIGEESGVRVGRVEYFGSQPWPLPQSLMVGFVAHADSTEIHVDGEEITDARWFTREQMRAEAAAGTLVLPGGVSISRHLVEWWYGAPLPGSW